MPVELTLSFDPTERILHIRFAQGELAELADVDRFAQALEARCSQLPEGSHLFFDLSNLTVPADLVEAFSERKRALSVKWAASTWHYGGQLAERVMTRNACTRRGERSNLYRTRDEALSAFRASRER